MKTLTTLLLILSLCLIGVPIQSATVTGRSQDSSLAGTEKIPADSSGVDTYILVSSLWNAMVLSGGVTASGSSAFDFSGSTGAFKTSTGANTFGGSSHTFASAITPASADGAALGSASLQWSDLFTASGSVLNFNNGDVTVTHSSGVLTVAGSGAGDLRVTTAGTNAASVATVGGTQTLTAKTLTSPVIATGLTASGSATNDFSASTGAFKTSTGLNTFGGSGHSFAAKLFPASDDGAALGDTTHHFSDLFLATGAVLNFQNGNVAVTHSSGILTMGTGELRITTAGTNAASVPTLGSTSTLTNKTLTAPVINGASSASGNFDLSGSSGTFKTTTGASTFGGSSATFASSITPATDDSGALGSTSLQWSDLFLASGGVLNFDNGDAVVTHSSGILTMGTGEFRVTTPGTNSASVPTLGSTSTLTNKTLTAPVIADGLTASGSAANTFAASTGTFITSTGANTLSGAVTINDATTPSLTTASGKTNTGYVQINGKTSGALKLIAADAAAQTVTVSLSAQTSGAATLAINDMAGVGASVMTSLLTSNSPGVVNSVWGASNSLVWEGTADGSEIVLDAADATADVVYRLPNAAAATYSVMSSTLATNAPNIANSVTGKSAGLEFEGTADASETTLTATDPTADRTATLPDASGVVKLFISEDVTATNVITATENGTVFYLNSATEFVSTLPAPAVGLEFTFIVKAAPSGADYTIVANGSGAGNDVIKGQAHITADAAGDAGTADDTISFVGGQAVAGDMVKVWSDGTSWFAHAFAAVAAGVTFTDAD